jgi:hypothetical protein
MNMTTQEYAEQISKVLNCKDYVNLANAIGNTLNSPKDRFDKSDILEQSIEVYSNGRFLWIDAVGKDHHDTVLDLYLEFKYVTNGIFTAKKSPKKTVTVKLKNSLGANKGINVQNPADYYMIAQQDSIALISWNDIKEYLVAVPDGIEARIPFEKLSFVFVSENKYTIDPVFIDYKKEKQLAQRKIIENARITH